MNGKPLAFIIGLPVMVGCCIGAPLFVGWLVGVGLFAWLADNTFAVIAVGMVAAAVVFVLRRHRKERRYVGARQGQAVERPAADAPNPSVLARRRRSPVR